MLWGALWFPYYALAVTTAAFVFYYWFFALSFLLRRRPCIPEAPASKRFLIVIPAHNEEAVLAKALDSVYRSTYPRVLYEVLVIADNCHDATAEIARKKGAQTLRRYDDVNRGKGHALRWAFDRVEFGAYDAVVVADADTVLDERFLAVMNAYLRAGYQVIQGNNGMSNPGDNPLTELIYVTNVLKNQLFNEAKHKLGLSVSLMGTGMCFDTRVIRQHGWTAFSVGEDWEYSAILSESGTQITFAPEAKTYAEEARSFSQAFGQRLRWAVGKLEVSWRFGLVALIRAVISGDLRRIDAALNVLVPNYSLLANLSLGQLVLTVWYPPGPLKWAWLGWAFLMLLLQAGYLLLGVLIGGSFRKTVPALLLAPPFLVWKLFVDLLAVLGVGRTTWSRTARNVEY
jgi:cellulose synthase/poly-beta-1,6-N-acetylglucosamine synthase-like glycosyltransferase